MREMIRFSIGQSSVAEISHHLQLADANFAPLLSKRVNIANYARKLHELAVCFEAWQGNELIGLVAAYCNDPEAKTAFVSSVSVLPMFQGQGIARQLIQHCIDHVQSLAIGQITLEVDAGNTTAVNLYNNLGFRTHHLIDSTLTMSMPLERPLI